MFTRSVTLQPLAADYANIPHMEAISIPSQMLSTETHFLNDMWMDLLKLDLLIYRPHLAKVELLF